MTGSGIFGEGGGVACDYASGGYRAVDLVCRDCRNLEKAWFERESFC